MNKELAGVIYEQAIEARAKINGLPNLHLLIGKSNEDNLYRALCLDSGIICMSEFNTLDKKTIDYLFDESCVLALNQFYRYVKEDKSLLLAGRCLNREYWDIYDELILPVKQKSLISILEQVQPFEKQYISNNLSLEANNNDEYKKAFESLDESPNNFIILINMILLLLTEDKKMYLKNFYEKETA